MVEKTPRRDLDDYGPGDTGWDHSNFVNDYDEHAIARDPVADRPAEGDYDDELFYATDQNVLWGWDEDASDWTIRGGTGSESQPLDSVHAESLNNMPATVTWLDQGQYVPLHQARLIPNDSTTSTSYTVLGDWDNILVLPSEMQEAANISYYVSCGGRVTSNDSANTAYFRVNGINHGAYSGSEFTTVSSSQTTMWGPRVPLSFYDNEHLEIQAKSEDGTNSAQMRSGMIIVWGRVEQ